MEYARLDAALLLCCLSPTGAISHDAAAAAGTSAAGLKAAALQAAKGSSKGKSAPQQAAGSCCLDMGSQGPASSRLSTHAS
jgi:hypothetical protein